MEFIPTYWFCGLVWYVNNKYTKKKKWKTKLEILFGYLDYKDLLIMNGRLFK